VLFLASREYKIVINEFKLTFAGPEQKILFEVLLL